MQRINLKQLVHGNRLLKPCVLKLYIHQMIII